MSGIARNLNIIMGKCSYPEKDVTHYYSQLGLSDKDFDIYGLVFTRIFFEYD